MSEPTLYRGQWPKNVSKTAKYSVRLVDRKWKVTVSYDLGEGLMFLAVEDGDIGIAERVNDIKKKFDGKEGGVFYINEYQHLIVPIARNDSSFYYYGGKVDPNFTFEFEGNNLSTKPVNFDGTPLKPGDKWIGPRPAIPYVLAAGGQDIYFETPALTETDPPEVRQRVTQKVYLSKVLKNKAELNKTLSPVYDVRGYSGGRFYVNEHQAIFTPVDNGDGDGLNYIYCGELDLTSWFPEPKLT